MLLLEDQWIWDSWIADDGDRWHLFFLKAPRSLQDPGLRHERATVGHAVSTDLVDWEVLPDALGPTPGRWDDTAIWTGSIVRGDDGLWRMFYTALGSRGHGLRDQRIGVATSQDLTTWHKVGDEPVLDVDTRWYRSLDEDPTASETWRDPRVFRDPDGDGWHMLVTARAVGHAPNDDGVIAHATSPDLDTWEVGPPLCEAGAGFGQLEVLQVHEVEGQPILLFTCHPQEMTPERRRQSGDHSTWTVAGDSLTGPWDISRAQPFTQEPALFAAPLVQRRDGTWALLGFRNLESEGILAFEIIDPVGVRLVNGVLVADSVPPA